MENKDLTARGKFLESFAENFPQIFIIRFPFFVFHSVAAVFFRRKVLHFLFAI